MMRKDFFNNSRGQITIFVIVALVLVAGIALYFVLTAERAPSEIARTAEENPNAFMQLCIESDLRANIALIEDQGGFIDPKDYQMYDDKKVSYLCKTNTNYETCVNQHPMILTEVNEEIANSISQVIEDCFIELEETYEGGAMDVEITGDTITNVELAPQKVFITIDKNIKITKNEEVSTYKKLDLGLRSGLYDLVHVVARIVNNEAQYCYFERTGYMNLHPEYEILMHGMSDGTKVYSIKDLETQEEMNIAIRGCTV